MFCVENCKFRCRNDCGAANFGGLTRLELRKRRGNCFTWNNFLNMPVEGAWRAVTCYTKMSARAEPNEMAFCSCQSFLVDHQPLVAADDRFFGGCQLFMSPGGWFLEGEVCGELFHVKHFG